MNKYTGPTVTLGPSPSRSNEHQEALAEIVDRLDFESTDEMIADAIEHGEGYGICMKCRYLQRVERDANGVECERCEENEVISGEVLIKGEI